MSQINENGMSLEKAKHRIDNLININNGFIENARKNSISRESGTSLAFEGENIAIDVFGYRAKGKQRVVRVNDCFYMEHLFVIDFDGADFEVARLYVGGGGFVYGDLEPEYHMCDYDNQYISSVIYKHVAYGILNSSLFAVSPKG